MEDTLTTVSAEMDGDVMLPDGFSDGDNFFDPDSWSGSAGGNEETADSPAGDDALAMGNAEEGGEDQSAVADEDASSPDGEVQATGKAARMIRVKHNHEEHEMNVDEMSDEELISHIQKSKAFDAAREAENKRRYQKVYQDQLDAGMTEALAKMVADHEVGGNYATTETPAAAPSAATDDLSADIAQLKALFPDFQSVPNEVAQAHASGVPLVTAYLAYRSRQSDKAAASAQRENKVLKQNATAAAKAPVRGVNGGGQAQPKVDPMLAAFDADDW